MNTQCPNCGTAYVVSEKDVGRRIVCTGCRKPLVVHDSGIRLDDRVETELLPLTRRIAQYRPPGDWATWLFSTGAVLVIVFVLWPQLASASVERHKARLGEETLDHSSYLKALRERNADPTAVKRAEETWQVRREALQDAIKEAEFARSRSGYWARFGLLLGYPVLAIGAIGWTRTRQSLVRRIIGAVVLTGQLLLLFQTVTPVGCSTAVRPYNSASDPSS